MPRAFLVRRYQYETADREVEEQNVEYEPEMKLQKQELENQEIEKLNNNDESYYKNEKEEKITAEENWRHNFEEYQSLYRRQLLLLNQYYLFLHSNKMTSNDLLYLQMKKQKTADEDIVKIEKENAKKLLYNADNKDYFIPNKVETKSTREQSSNKLYPCKVCLKTFDRSSSLSNHMLIHNNTKSFECKKCHLCFLRKSDLSKHEIIHSGEKPYKCQTCGKSFSQSSNMLTHQRRHTGIRPFACKKCGKSFYRKVDVRRHNLIHRNN